MDSTLLNLYDNELSHLRSYAKRFAASGRYGEIARRLKLGEDADLRDPFIEWLLDGSAFMSARVQYAIEAEFPKFTESLLSIIFPHLSAPTPSMMVAQLAFNEPSAADLAGKIAPRGTELGRLVPSEDSSDDKPGVLETLYTTARDLWLWPAWVSDAAYLQDEDALRALTDGRPSIGKSGISITLKLPKNAAFSTATRDTLDLFIHNDQTGGLLAQALAFSDAQAFVVTGTGRRAAMREMFPISVAPLGYDNDEDAPDSLLPYDRRSFEGYRLLHEFFALPARFQFIRLSGLNRAFSTVDSDEVTLVFGFDRAYPRMVGKVQSATFRTNCVPAINLFRKSADNLSYDLRRHEHQLVMDAGAAMNYEVHSVLDVRGRDGTGGRIQFQPFFSTPAFSSNVQGDQSYYIVNRRAKYEADTELTNARSRTESIAGEASDYGSEVFLSFVDTHSMPMQGTLSYLNVDTLCTNRHHVIKQRYIDRMERPRPLTGNKSFDESFLRAPLTISTTVGKLRAAIVAGPSRPRAPSNTGRRRWDIVSHLSLNALSIVHAQDGNPARALQQLLRLYAPDGVGTTADMIDGLRRVESRPRIGRMPVVPRTVENPRPIPAMGTRGIEVDLTFSDDTTFAPLLAAILERFFAGYVSANSFSKTRLLDPSGQVRLEWSERTGIKTVL